MKLTVIDASVAIKWFVKEEEKRTEAIDVLMAITSQPSFFAVPDLFFEEMLSVLARLQPNSSGLKANLSRLENLGFHRIRLGHDVLMLAAELATDHKLSGYDAIYAASAKLIKGKWLTADKRAAQKIKSIGITELL